MRPAKAKASVIMLLPLQGALLFVAICCRMYDANYSVMCNYFLPVKSLKSIPIIQRMAQKNINIIKSPIICVITIRLFYFSVHFATATAAHIATTACASIES